MSFSKDSSRIFGLIAGFKFFKPLQKWINESYVKYFNIDMSEFKSTDEYESLNALFTRKLKKERNLDEGFISPSDGRILQSGETFLADNEFFAFSIKGRTYSVEELLKDSYEKEELKNGLDYANIYLSPKDYHRYHAPCDMQILSLTYTSGALFSVNEKHLFKIANLYTQNERVSLKCKSSEKGFIFWLVFVGAQNVGKMCFSFDKSVQTNMKIARNFTRKYENLNLKKGEELGNFELGSTIVVLSQKGHLHLKPKTMVKFGEKFADFL
ncbi:phosphatidylserine decarboxylase [Campylobacter helveticus]|uniref:phosphatidylserine decarboxylase n=1 Tax=Campylobacter helveticus TaxID=28898 RepID=A0AAX2UHZ3_9BACT|nr:phosphatidylserine decarboxylase [Campylobacter helveticus]ARE80502.1 phosphatidylserine decarboxylase, proenzyme [Campylobacter helveticus]MCR2055347.1 phosphatidylserine decarboxylase [Campylobacter helveticus]TNB57139.1 phosphatidylserine decarboxylase [Campylobacter helveticus]TNB59349.1 phosphatidylserine decarboxylase [Campylobacter helveticus]TNH32555.1 phosphatidylserine decarboxylase [Campylobacter helveticus]